MYRKGQYISFMNAPSKRIPTHCHKSGFSYMVHNIPSQAP